MISISINIDNPFGKDVFRNLYCWFTPLTKNKMFEFEIMFHNKTLLNFELNTRMSGYDHAGPEVYVGLLGLAIHAHIYDRRHWDLEKNTWEEHDD